MHWRGLVAARERKAAPCVPSLAAGLPLQDQPDSRGAVRLTSAERNARPIIRSAFMQRDGDPYSIAEPRVKAGMTCLLSAIRRFHVLRGPQASTREIC